MTFHGSPIRIPGPEVVPKAKRLLTWGKVYDNEKFSRRGKSILKRLEKMERIDRPALPGSAATSFRISSNCLA